MVAFQEVNERINYVQKLGYTFKPSANEWFFEFACQFLEHYRADPIVHAKNIPEIMHSKASGICYEGEFSTTLRLNDIPDVIEDIRRNGNNLTFDMYNLRQAYK